MVEYGRELNVSAVNYIARTDMEYGHDREYEVYLSNDPKQWGQPAAKGRIRRDAAEELIQLPQPVKARYLKFVVVNAPQNQQYATIAELQIIEAKPAR